MDWVRACGGGEAGVCSRPTQGSLWSPAFRQAPWGIVVRGLSGQAVGVERKLGSVYLDLGQVS